MIKKLGYKVLQAANGMEAVQIFRNNAEAICLVILDTILPDESGLDTCRRLKEISSDVKVLHTSGLGKTQGGEDLECGCDEFLPKPFRMKELSHSLVDLALYT
jgi:DNA-binding response OmpR family regulator